MPPPDSFNVTSLRVRPSRASASVTVESLSEPNLLTPITPPLSSAAVFTPGAEKEADHVAQGADGADIAASAVDADHRGQAHVHDVEPAGLQLGRAAAAAAHVDDVDLEP